MTESEAELAAILNRGDRMLSEIEQQAREAGPNRRDNVLAQNRSRVYELIDELGEWLAEFHADYPSGEEAARVRDMVSRWLTESSSTGPVFAQMRDLAQGKGTYHELMQHLHAERPSGANMTAMVLNDYYLHAKATQAGRGRFELLGQTLEQEMRSRVSAGQGHVDVLCLQYVGGTEWKSTFGSADLARALHITCVDGSTEGSRHARQMLAEQRGARVQVVRSDPLPYLESAQVPSDAFDVAYALNLVERLSNADAGRLIRGSARVLRSGGVLITGSFTPSVPTSEKMLRKVMVEWNWQYRTEHDWERLYWGTPFDIETLKFEYEPAKLALLVIATRR